MIKPDPHKYATGLKAENHIRVGTEKFLRVILHASCQSRIYKEVAVWQSSGSMAGKNKVRITVLKKLSSKEIFGDDPPLGENVDACRVYDVGQEFIVGEDGEMPEGFCHWAWNDLYKIVTALRYGANWESGKKETGAPTIHCCTDGLRPVIFKLERTAA